MVSSHGWLFLLRMGPKAQEEKSLIACLTQNLTLGGTGSAQEAEAFRREALRIVMFRV